MVGFSEKHFCLFINIFLVVLSVLICLWSLNLSGTWFSESNILFIAIPSSPDHIAQRQSLRNTWLKLLPDKSYNYKFILGRRMCNIHPDDRNSEYSCESLNIFLPNDGSISAFLHASSLKKTEIQLKTGLGFSFLVHHPVIIQSLGIHRNALKPGSQQIIRVFLSSMNDNELSSNYKNSFSKISSVTFHSATAFEDINNESYVYKKLSNPVELPKGFEGMVMIEKANEFNEEDSCSYLTNWEHGNVFTISSVITAKSVEDSRKKFCVLASFGFMIKDRKELERAINQTDKREMEWNIHTSEIQEKIRIEADHYKDILFLDMVDVYRNLPQKMLLFFRWLFENFKNVKHVLKTDDDSFIDILKINEELQKQGDWDWWSCFRIGWPVKRHGKWRETFLYKEKIYPPFPSGAGYVLSERALQGLKNSLDTLSVGYQGEDVAIGIWLQEMALSCHGGEVCYWACVEQCHPRSCNVMQLSVSDMYRVWHNYKNCGNMCDCPTGGEESHCQFSACGGP